MDAPILSDAGAVSHKKAVTKAEGEYEKYHAQLSIRPSDVESEYLKSVKKMQRKIEGEK